MIEIKQHIFREYDIRGLVDQDLSVEFARLLGNAYGALAKESGMNSIAIGYDCRPSSEPYALALAQGLTEAGVDCLNIGCGSTPKLYFTIHNRKLGGGIQITGSHNPSSMNGFKICLGTKTLSGDEIRDLYSRVQKAQKAPTVSSIIGTLTAADVDREYLDFLVNNSRPHLGKRKLKIVVDAGNGVGGIIAVPALQELGVEVVPIFCEPDGDFPNHHPDPTVVENLTELIRQVRIEKADFGIGWDGDGDRIGVVDETGEVVFGDLLMLIFARDVLRESPGATIIGDVKCSSRLFDGIAKAGGKPLMWKTGHSLIKAKLRETNGALAGEMSGHIFFKHRYFGFDDAAYCSCRLVEIMSRTSGPFSSLLSDLPPTISTPELRVDCAEEIKFKVSAAAQKAFADFPVSTIDGVRIEFPHGWGLIRASNTQPVLVLRFEADTEARLAEYQTLVETRLAQIQAEVQSGSR